MKKIAVFLVLTTLLVASSVFSQDGSNQDLLCPEENPEMSVTRYARGLSLDLRGVVPTVEEMETIREAGEVSESLLDDWLHEPSFTERVLEYQLNQKYLQHV